MSKYFLPHFATFLVTSASEAVIAASALIAITLLFKSTLVSSDLR